MSKMRSAVMFLITATSEDLASRDIEMSIIETMDRNEQLTTLHVPPLPASEHRELIKRSLPLDRELVERLASRTAGNPRFALDLLRSLVDQNRLSMGSKGYTLAEGRVIDMATSLAEVWDTRLATFLEARHDHEAESLELAACLGLQVNLDEWTALCRVADVTIEPRLKRDAVEQRFVTEFKEKSGEASWHFAHGMLREAILRNARRMGRLERHHNHAVNMLRVADAPPSRIGKHLLSANQWNAALGPLERAVNNAMHQGDHRAAQSALIDWTDALRLLNFPDNRRDWLRISLADAQIRYIQGNLSEGLKTLERILQRAKRRPYHRILCKVLLLQSAIYIKLAQFEKSLETLNRLEQIPERHLDAMDLAQGASQTGQTLEKLGQFSDAERFYERAETTFLQADHIVPAQWHVWAERAAVVVKDTPTTRSPLLNQPALPLAAQAVRWVWLMHSSNWEKWPASWMIWIERSIIIERRNVAIDEWVQISG